MSIIIFIFTKSMMSFFIKHLKYLYNETKFKCFKTF